MKRVTFIFFLVASGFSLIFPLNALSAPFIRKLKPSTSSPKEVVRIVGSNFGDTQGGSLVNVGSRTYGSSSSRIKLWTDSKIKIRLPSYQADSFKGANYFKKRICVTVDGIDSNKKTLWIVRPGVSVWKQVLKPNDDGQVSWNTSQGGNHHVLVSDGDDATYVETSNNGTDEYFSFEKVEKAGYPLAVRLWIRGRSYDNAHRKVRLDLHINNTRYGEPVNLTDVFEDFYMEWEKNPDTGLPWKWSDISSLMAGIRCGPSDTAGGRISRIWLEVIGGKSHSSAFLTHGPIFGGVTDDTIRVWTRTSGPSTVAIRYGTREQDVKENTGDTQTTAGLPVDSSTDYTLVADVAGLPISTRIYFDLLIDGTSVYSLEGTDNPYRSSLPSCSTFPPEYGDTDFDFVVGADIHGPALDHQVFHSIAAKNPKFYLDLGDQTSNITDDPFNISQKYRELRTFGVTGRHLVSNVLSRMPMFRIWSDHDAVQNNCHKFGLGTYGSIFDYRELQNSLHGFRQYTPLPLQEAPDDIIGTATGGADQTLVDTGASFDASIHPGMVVSKTTGTRTYSFVKSVDSTTQIMLSQSLGEGQSFADGVGYHIHKGGLWYKFRCGNAEFFVIDTRYKRDPNGTPGGDMLDGTRFGSPPKVLGTSTDEQPYRLIDDSADFTSSVNQGDVVMNMTMRTYALVTNIDSAFEVSLNEDVMKVGQAYEVFESGGTVGGSGHVQRDWLVSSVNSSYAKWKFIVCEIPFLHDEAVSQDKWADYDPLDALRGYLVNHITADNVVWLSGDGHFAALDDAGHGDDPWPSVSCANLSCSYGNDPQGTWLVNGQSAEFSADDGAKGGFSVVRVRSDHVEVQAYKPDGSIAMSGPINLTMSIPLSP